jgi:general secretion pathway protein C
LASVLLLRTSPVETLLRKYLWAVDLAVVALCATFLGMAASGAVASKFASMPAPVRAPAAKAAKAETKIAFNKDPTGILKRNVFCSACPPILGEAKKDDEPVEAPPEPPAKTTLPLAILAIMYEPPAKGTLWSNTRWSMAVLRDTEQKVTGAYSIGGVIHGAKVVDILETRLYFDNAGKIEYLDLFEPPAPPTPPKGAEPPPAPNKDTDPFAADLAKGIKKLSDNKYELQRNTLESVLGNMNLLSRSARIVPEMKDGKASGFRLFAVRPDGPFAMIGMQNGDILSSINGLEITSPEKALEVYAKLKSASHLSLGMERNGQKITKEYNIR